MYKKFILTKEDIYQIIDFILDNFIINNTNYSNFNLNSSPNSNPNFIIALKGDLGAGKTYLAKKLIAKLTNLKESEIISPTFNILKIYDIDHDLYKGFLKDQIDKTLDKIYHYDLYRLKKEEEIYNLSIEEAFSQITILEWPERIKDLLSKQKNILIIKITIKNEKERRRIFELFYEN